MSQVADLDAPVTSEWLAQQTFEPWDPQGLKAISDEEWASAANPHAFLIRFSLGAMSLDRDQLADALTKMGTQDAVTLVEGIESSIEWFEHWTQLLKAIRERLYTAAAVLELQAGPN